MTTADGVSRRRLTPLLCRAADSRQPAGAATAGQRARASAKAATRAGSGRATADTGSVSASVADSGMHTSSQTSQRTRASNGSSPAA